MTRAALAKLSLLGSVAALVAFGTGCSQGAKLSSLSLTPGGATIEVGTTQTFTVAANFDDGTKAALTSGITWTSSNASVASVSVAGVVTGVSAGTANILASAQGLQVSASVTITPLAVKSISATPTTVSLAAGLTQQLAVTATMDDNSIQDVTAGSSYTTSAAAVATVSTGGKITAVAVGTATITATASGKSATVAVTVTAATIVSLAVTPNTVSIIEGQTKQLTVSATYTDGAVKAPDAVTYTSDSAAKATVSATGLVTGVAAGGTNVNVTAGGKSVVVPVTVTAKNLLSIAATPASMTLAAGGVGQITVVGTYDNSATSTLTTGVTFTSSATAKATVSSTGLVTGVAAGPATITVSAGSGINATVQVTVTTAVIVSLTIAPTAVPATGKFYVGDTQALVVTGHYSDSTPAAVVPNANITWTTSAAAVATISAAGVVTGVTGGTATVTATVGTVSQPVTVTVTPQTLVSIAAAAGALQVGVGLTSQLAITATFDGGPTKVVTSSATYSSSDATVATVSTGGLVTGVNSGTATITASYTAGAVTKTATVAVTVSAAELVFFHGAFGPNTNSTFANFGDATPYDVSIDTTGANDYAGFHPLKFVNPATFYSGGAIVAKAARDLSGYNALTFYAKASKALTLPVSGFGDNASGDSGYKSEVANLALTTTYQKYVFPLPDPSKATAMTGLFYLADGVNHSDAGAVTLYFADMQYEKLAGTPGGAPTAAFTGAAKTLEVGATQPILSGDLTATLPTAIAGSAAPSPLTYAPAGVKFFTWSTTPAGIATVSTAGVITGVAGGSTAVKGTLAGVNTSNTLAVTVIAPLPAPTVAAPTPTLGADKVTSIWSSVKYNGTAADMSAKVNFSEFAATPNPFQGPYTIPSTSAMPQKFVFLNVPGHYSGLGFHTAVADEVDATTKGYDTMHMDVWSPDIATPVGAVFVVGLIDFAAAGGTAFGSQGNLTLSGAGITNSASSGPQGGWISYDFKIADFKANGLAAAHNLAQMLIQVNKGATVYIDNLYFYSAGGGCTSNCGGSAPTTVAATPANAPANVISLFSSTYTGGTAGGDYSANVGSYDASCFGGAPGSSTVADYTIAGTSHKVKQYTVAANSFISIETIGATGGTTPGGDSAICNGGTQSGANRIDISQMKGLHLDVWASKAAVTFNGSVFTAPTLPFTTGAGAVSVAIGNQQFAAGTWVSLDIPFGDLSQITKMSMLQLFSGEGGTIFLDNVYFYKTGGTTGGSAFSPVTFDNAALTYTITTFEGAANGAVVADPANASNKVASFLKATGGNPWAGATISTGANQSVGKIPFTATNKKMTMKVYSPRAGLPMHLKVENSADGSINAEVNATATVTAANTWQTFTFDFGTTGLDPTKTYDKVSVFPDFLNTAANDTFLFDDISIAFPTVTFDDAAVTYTITTFEGAANGAVVADPANASNKVASFLKATGGNPWAGATISTGANQSVGAIPFTASSKKMTVKIYSPRAGLPMHLKIENSTDGSINAEVNATATVTAANTWQTFTFDFSSTGLDPTKTYDKVSVFPDFLNAAANDTFLFDDIAFVP